MYCTNCGRKLTYERFCPVCGTENFELDNANNNQETEEYDYYDDQYYTDDYAYDNSMTQQNEDYSQYGGVVASRLCCPNCGNPHLQITTETSTVTTGSNYSAGKGCLGYLIFGPLGLLCGTCGQGQQTTSTNTTYCVCPSCGNKFRNPDEQQKAIASSKKITIGVLIATVCLVLFLFVLGNAVDSIEVIVVGGVYGVFVGIMLLILGVANTVQQSNIDKLYEEMDEWNNRRG